jgi:type I restriction enzyme M protein
MEDCWLHTILRLPVGTFTPYSTGVKANVLFFRKGMPTEEVWIYDLRTNVRKVTKRQPLTEDYFADFLACYGPDPTPKPGKRQKTERFQRYTREEIAGRDDNLDIFWLKDENLDDPADLPEPEDILGEAMTQLQTAMTALDELAAILNGGGEVYE